MWHVPKAPKEMLQCMYWEDSHDMQSPFLLHRMSDDLFDPSTVSVTSPLHRHGNWHRTSSSDSDGVPASPTKTTAGVC